MSSPYEPPNFQAPQRAPSDSWLWSAACLLAWPLGVIGAWIVNDWQREMFSDQLRSGLYPFIHSPGVVSLIATLLPYGWGAFLLLSPQHRKLGYLFTLAAALIATLLSIILVSAAKMS